MVLGKFPQIKLACYERLKFKTFIMAKDLTENQLRDYRKYYVDKPDSSFNPDRSRQVVNNTIAKYEKKRAEKEKAWIDQFAERADAVASYLIHLNTSKTTSLETYFGRRFLAYLRGQQIVQKIKRLKDGRKIITLDEVV